MAYRARKTAGEDFVYIVVYTEYDDTDMIQPRLRRLWA